MPVLHLLLAATALGVAPGPAAGQSPTVDELVSAVVRVKTFIDPDARTLQNLGREREGSGIVIDDQGLVLTIGYLMVEAYAAEVTTNDDRRVPADVIGYDHETGFGLLRATAPLKVRPLSLGRSAELRPREAVIVASFGGAQRAMPALVVARGEFAGSWEYLLEDAIFTAPPHPSWGGAALINREGKLVGIGSLLVADASRGSGERMPGNMFVPIDLLSPIFADLLSSGRVARPARPWLGMNTEETANGLVVNRVAPNGPAAQAGVAKGDVVVAINGNRPVNLADFYRKLWATGAAGVTVRLDVQRDGDARTLSVRTMNRYDHLRLNSTF